MQYTKLGKTGITVSRICLGCMTYGGGPQPPWAMRRDWALGAEEAREHFAVALEAGVNFFDTLTPTRLAPAKRSPGAGLRRWRRAMMWSSPRRCMALWVPGPTGAASVVNISSKPATTP
jgi:predicted aldo/keto reductase-like oxidoreductase